MYSNIEQQIEETLKGYHNFVPAGLRNKLLKIGKKLDFEAKGCISWCADDIISRARECREYYLIPKKEQAQEILEEMIDNHDCNYGITWETIDAYLTSRKKERR